MPRIRFNRTFKHADDGVTVVTHPAGSVHDVSDRCAEVAIQERAGELTDGPAQPDAADVDTQPETNDDGGDGDDDAPSIPDGWEQMSWPERRALAAFLADEGQTIRTSEDAADVINAALERRAG